MVYNLASVLLIMIVLPVGACLMWGAVDRAVTKRRLRRIHQSLGIVPDEQLLLGLAELRRAVLLRDRGESR